MRTGGDHRVYVDSAPHFVANAALTVAAWHGWNGSFRMRAINHYRLVGDGSPMSIACRSRTSPPDQMTIHTVILHHQQTYDGGTVHVNQHIKLLAIDALSTGHSIFAVPPRIRALL